MKKAHRLTKDRDFRRVRGEGKSWGQTSMMLFARANGLEVSRYGFVVSKHIGKATVRNRVKRLMREAVRQFHPQIPPGWDLVLLARKPIAGRTYWEIVATVEELLNRSRLVSTLPKTSRRQTEGE